MERFAKLYEDETIGQVLVLLDEDEDEHPEITHLLRVPTVGMVRLKAKFSKHSEEQNWKNAEEAFENISKETAFRIAKDILKQVEGMLK